MPIPRLRPLHTIALTAALGALCTALLTAPVHADAATPVGPTPAAASAPAPAPADNDATPKAEEAGMWIGTSAVICLAQDATLAATPFGRQLTESASYAAWHEQQHPAVLACFSNARLLSPALCKDIFAQDPSSHEDHSRALYDKHATTIARLARMDDCTSR